MIKLNGNVINFKQFPNNEVMLDVTVLNYCKEDFTQSIMFKFDNDSTLMHLFLLKSFLTDNGFKDIDLVISYMPYSRMDRVSDSYVFSLKYITNFINSMNFSRVFVAESHSDVTPALLDRAINIILVEALLKNAVENTGFDPKVDYIYFPDVTAEKRYSKYCKAYTNQLIGMKDRDFATGNIIGITVIGDMPEYKDEPKPKVIMIDDLCSKGGTFIGGAKTLKEMGAGEIFLVVAHCENTVFHGSLLDGDYIEHVFTTNSIIEVQHQDRMTISEIF